jgi:hypothetical protein
VPKAELRSEDDGYLLDLVMAGDRADLIVMDAITMTEQVVSTSRDASPSASTRAGSTRTSSQTSPPASDRRRLQRCQPPFNLDAGGPVAGPCFPASGS